MKPMPSGSAHSVEHQLTAAVDQSELRHQPFDHIYMDNVLDPGTYQALLVAMPDRRSHHGLRHRDAMRADGTSTRLRLHLYPELVVRFTEEQRRAWLRVAHALGSPGPRECVQAQVSRHAEQALWKVG